jgi:hypothetical protein
MLNLTTPITTPTITRADVRDQADRRDSINGPRFELTVEFRTSAANNRSLGLFGIVARDAVNSTRISLNPVPTGYGDIILTSFVSVPNACTLLAAAYDNAAGTRQAKRDAAYAAAVGLGLIDAALAAT